MAKLSSLRLSSSFVSLGDDFYSVVQPTPFKTDSRVVHVNDRAIELLDLDSDIDTDPLFLDVFSGKSILPNTQPLAMLYAGHQFGHFVSQLGDGRAIMLAETINSRNEKWELQLKGSGLTPYSRDGDGRAVLRSSIREYLCSAAMSGLGIPTTEALCLITSDDEVYRERIEPGAMITRMAPSHIRFGSFEVFYYRNQFEQIKKLADFVIKHHYPEFVSVENRYELWFEKIVDRTAYLIAQWQAVGFAHGVMNSDNMSILGLTIDYGPFGFMENYQPGYVCNHSDHQGRYAFDQQPHIGLFNLSCLAQALLPLFDEDSDKAVSIAQEKLSAYQSHYVNHYATAMRLKLGLENPMDSDFTLATDLLELMAKDKVDYSNFFRNLCVFGVDDNNNSKIREMFLHREAFDSWADIYRRRLGHEKLGDQQRSNQMKRHNPKYILRNYMAEVAIQKAEREQDFSEIDDLMRVLAAPFEEHSDYERFTNEAPAWAGDLSVSCSS
ncbi:MAG: YdiU family protein [Thiohalomonadales bacterium]